MRAASEASAPRGGAAATDRVMLANVLVVAVCALVYELLCGTLASYLLGNAVVQFSLVLGTYAFAMGIGALASRRLEARAAERYVQAELLLALVGGLSIPLLFAAFDAHVPLRFALHAVVFVVGALVGLELPLLVRVLRRRAADPGAALPADPAAAPAAVEAAPRFGDVVARALAFDYLGALVASVLFPLVLVPRLGLVRTSILAGAVNAAMALSATFVLRLERARAIRAAGVVVLGVLALAFARGEAWVQP